MDTISGQLDAVEAGEKQESQAVVEEENTACACLTQID